MNHTPSNCEKVEGLLAAFIEGSLSAGDEATVSAHLKTCASCRESSAAFSRIEEALALRRSEVPAVDAFLPDFAALRPHAAAAVPAQSRLTQWFRAMMTVPGIASILVVWSALFLLRYSHAVGQVFTWTSLDRLSMMTNIISSALLGVAGGDAYTLTAIYLALTLLVLGSTGAITLRFIRR